MQALDTSQSTIGKIGCLNKTGIRAVGRYYSKSAWKRLTLAEAQALSRAGIALWTVYQDANDSYADFTAARGRDHAARAVDQARGVIGQPEGSAIYFAVDYDASPREAAGRIAAYFAAVGEVFIAAGSPYRIGVYGNGAVCGHLLDAGLAKLAWLSMSTGHHGHCGFARSGRWALRQRAETTLCGIACDPNDLRAGADDSAFGGFRLSVSQLERLRVNATRLNLRDAPNGRVLAQLGEGQIVERIGASTRKGWIRLRANGTEGHAFAAYLRPAD